MFTDVMIRNLSLAERAQYGLPLDPLDVLQRCDAMLDAGETVRTVWRIRDLILTAGRQVDACAASAQRAQAAEHLETAEGLLRELIDSLEDAERHRFGA